MTSKELKEWRTGRNLTQLQLGDILGVTKACISRWEAGKRPISAFLHLALKCLKEKRGGEAVTSKGKKTEKKKKGGKR